MQPSAAPHGTAAAGGARLAAAAALTWARASSCAGTLSPCTCARIWTMVAACASQLALRAACMRCQASSSGCPEEASKRQCAMLWLRFKNAGSPDPARHVLRSRLGYCMQPGCRLKSPEDEPRAAVYPNCCIQARNVWRGPPCGTRVVLLPPLPPLPRASLESLVFTNWQEWTREQRGVQWWREEHTDDTLTYGDVSRDAKWAGAGAAPLPAGSANSWGAPAALLIPPMLHWFIHSLQALSTASAAEPLRLLWQ
jgi:hypothetical protein